MKASQFLNEFKHIDSFILSCPSCHNQTLKGDKNRFLVEETNQSKLMQQHPDFEPEWLSGVETHVFSCILKCVNPSCSQVVACNGIGTLDWDYEEDEDGFVRQVFTNFYKAHFFTPSLNFFSTPENCPVEVSNMLNEAFRLTFISPSSASNKVRIAIEILLSTLKIPKTKIIKGKRTRISLHNRIKEAKNKKPKLGKLEDILTALKWIGNSGSHEDSSELTLDDIFNAYKLMEYVLSEIYLPNDKLLKFAKSINKNKGLSKKK